MIFFCDIKQEKKSEYLLFSLGEFIFHSFCIVSAQEFIQPSPPSMPSFPTNICIPTECLAVCEGPEVERTDEVPDLGELMFPRKRKLMDKEANCIKKILTRNSRSCGSVVKEPN